MTNEQALSEFEAASLKVRRLADSGMGNLAPRRSAEARYSQTYQRLVRLGMKPQIKGKYR